MPNKPPYGMRRTKKNRKVHPHPDEQRWLAQCRAWYAMGVTYTGIAIKAMMCYWCPVCNRYLVGAEAAAMVRRVRMGGYKMQDGKRVRTGGGYPVRWQHICGGFVKRTLNRGGRPWTVDAIQKLMRRTGHDCS